MAVRVCERCGKSLEGRRPSARFCGDTCRKRQARNPDGAGQGEGPVVTDVADALRIELVELRVAETYEGVVALGIARQLDGGSVVGAAYSSLSKELDRRVDALRLKAVRKDDKVVELRDRLGEKRQLLA